MNLNSRIDKFLGKVPALSPSSFVANNATLIGDVTLGEESSVWYQCVLRADINSINVGPRSNIQDGAVVHLADDFGVRIGELVTVGHKAILHACTIGNEVLVGMNAVILDGAEIGDRCIVGAGALVTGHKKFPPGTLILGSPAKAVRELSLEEQAGIKTWAQRYVELSREYLRRGIK
jgi:gamma-carbonic anhydrase